MALRVWVRSPRNLVILFLGVTFVLVAALGWLGSRLFQQDRALESQRVRERLEHAADLVAAGLQLRLAETEEALTRLSTVPASELPIASAAYVDGQLSRDALVVALSDGGVRAYPPARLLYHPVAPSTPEPARGAFARGEALEFRERDYAGAIGEYRRLARSDESATRAGALLRLGRTLRKAGRPDAALGAYDELAQLDSVPVDGLPAGLVARFARLEVLEEQGRVAAATREAGPLRDDLYGGRWPITRAAFEFYAREVEGFSRSDGEPVAASGESAVAPARALAGGVAWLWDATQSEASQLSASGDREIVWIEDRPVLVVWRSSAERTVGLVGGREHLEVDWLGELEPILVREGVAVALSDAEGHGVTTDTTGATAVASGATGVRVVRAAAETRLPWTLHVTSADPGGDLAQLAERRRLVTWGLVALGLLVLLGLYAVVRGVSRELEMARLQSDFVAAVSHEFRTPLTSMRQLTELLASGRVVSEERRGQYYDVIRRESERLHRLVEGLLDFGRMEAGALEFHWQPVDAVALTRNVVEEFQAELEDGGHQVVLEVPQAAYHVRADEDALSRALWNLLDNAVKYSPDCKTVWVDVERGDHGVTMRVRDHGAGIAPEERRTIFEKFVRGAASHTSSRKGTGIGLAMVKHIVEAHHGEIEVESEVGEGSTFTIRLLTEE
jgi:signal transduction histidine kinase